MDLGQCVTETNSESICGCSHDPRLVVSGRKYLSMFGSECHSGRRVVGATVGPLSRPPAGWALHWNAAQRSRRGATCALLDNEHRYTSTLLCAGVVLVLVVELLNTAIESAIDRVGPEWHDLSKRAKDMGSAAVLLSLLLCLGMWVAALYHRIG